MNNNKKTVFAGISNQICLNRHLTILTTAVLMAGPLHSTAASAATAYERQMPPPPPAMREMPQLMLNAKPGEQPVIAPARMSAMPQCVGEFGTTANVVLPEGKSGVLNLTKLGLPSPSWLRTLADPEVLQVEPLTSILPRNMFILFGKKIGTTNLMLQTKDGRCAMVEVAVGIDTVAVQTKLNQLMPNEKDIRINAAADALVISGTVADVVSVEKILSIANAFVRKSGGPGAAAAAERVVNMLSIAAPQQVMLEVKVAEISKTLLDQLGSSFSSSLNRTGWAAGLVSNFFKGSSAGLEIAKTSNGNSLTLDAERKEGIVKILAEPTIMAISGQEGSFLAGGKIFIPTAQDKDGRITLTEKEYGVGLRFTPTVLDGGRINLQVSPEVSELSREGIGISTSLSGGTAVLPLITTRRASTTVQLFDGQSFAIGGLIKNNVTQNIKALPVLGEVPVLGALFRSSDFQTDRTELVFIITPHLAKPLPAVYPLPTDGFVPPNRTEFFLGGKMEGEKSLSKPSGSGMNHSEPQVPAASARATAPSGFEIK